MSKNTIIEMWELFGKVPTNEDEDGNLTLAEQFMGWDIGTDIKEVWTWFDEQFEKWGGVASLLYETQKKERKFTVETPDGIIECYSKHEGIDCQCDYPGVYIDFRSTDEQKKNEVVGDLLCCVEYDSGKEKLQVVTYADLADDSPSFGDWVNHISAELDNPKREIFLHPRIKQKIIKLLREEEGILPVVGYGESVKL